MIIETERLFLLEMAPEDFDALYTVQALPGIRVRPVGALSKGYR